MDKKTISFRLDSEKVNALDDLAEALDRDRSYLLNEAVAAYLDLQQWHILQIKASIQEAEAGKLIEHDEVKKLAGRWRRQR